MRRLWVVLVLTCALLVVAVVMPMVARADAPTYDYLRDYPSPVTAHTFLDAPMDVAVDGAGSVYVVQYDPRAVVKYDASGGEQWYVGDSGDATLSVAEGIAIRAGLVYVTDRDNHRIEVLDAATGAWQRNISAPDGVPLPQSWAPCAIRFDSAGHLWVADASGGPCAVQELDTDGQLLGSSNDPDLKDVWALTVDAQGNVYVLSVEQIGSWAEFLVYKYDSFGGRVPQWTPLSVWGAHGIHVDADGYVYVAGFDAAQVGGIDVFNQVGDLVTRFAAGTGPAYGGWGAGLTGTANGTIYLASWTEQAVKSYARNIPGTHRITATAGEHGAIYGSYIVYDGDSPSYTIAPDAGFEAAEITVDGQSQLVTPPQPPDPNLVDNGDGSYTYTFPDVTSGHTIIATFAPAIYSLSYAASENGTIKGASPQAVAWGADGVEVTAVPGKGYHFVSWSDGVLTAARTETFVTRDVAVTASFALDMYEWVRDYPDPLSVPSNLSSPGGIAADAAGNVFVVDLDGYVAKYDALGCQQWYVGGIGTGAGEFQSPWGIAVRDGLVYVTDPGNHRIAVFHADDGAWERDITAASWMTTPEDWRPHGVGFDSGGDLWVTDIPTAGDPAVEQIETDGGLVSSRGDYHLSSPSWLAVDPSDNVWVSDSSGHVVRFDSAGDPVDSWMMPNENGSPAGVGVGADGSVYLVWNRGSMAPPCVGVFDSTGSLLTWFGVGSAAGALTEPFGLTVAADGTVYVGDYGQRQVKSFAKIAPEADFAAPPTVGAGGTSFTIGTTQTVAWSMTAPVTDGHFNVVANDAAHKTSYLIESIAADGSADYSWDWPIAQPAGTGWHITVEWDKAGGGTVTSADSATFALRGPALAIATPSSGVFASGTSTTVGWTLGEAVSSGSFRVWLKDTTSGAWVRVTPKATPVPAAAGKTSYSVPWNVTQPLGTYRLWVYYYGPDGTTVISTAASSGTLTIAAKPTPTIVSPNSGVFTSSSATTVEWSMSAPVGKGFFRVWLRNTVTNAWVRITPSASPVPAVPGETAYRVPWNVTQPIGAYKLWVFYYGPDGTTAVSTAVSSGTLTIGPKPVPTVVSPNSGSLTRGSGTTVEWSMNTAVATGSFRVWLKNTVTNAWVRVTPTANPVLAAPGETAYSVTWFVTQPAATYKLWVYYYAADGTVSTTDQSSGTITLL